MPSVSLDRPLSEKMGEILLRIARRAIRQRLSGAAESPEDTDACQGTDLADLRGSCFVTLTLEGVLRGCIGSFRRDEPLCHSVHENALNAAFSDPRFPPLRADELEGVRIEVSVLSPPVRLAYGEPGELPGRLSPGEDGVVLRKGLAQATFLPQVWKQLPRTEEFLSHLCLKAGLGADAWKKGTLEVETYRVQSFEEEPPPHRP